MNPSTDSKAIEKTKRRLRKALLSIISAKHREKISVKELTEEADISRATFYLHYKDIEDFYNDVIDYVFSLFTEQIILFMRGSFEEAKTNSKKSNLLMKDEDRELLKVLFSDYFNLDLFNNRFKAVYDRIIGFAIEMHGKEFAEKHDTELRFFINGYIFAIAESLAFYNQERLYGDLIRSFLLWRQIDNLKGITN